MANLLKCDHCPRMLAPRDVAWHMGVQPLCGKCFGDGDSNESDQETLDFPLAANATQVMKVMKTKAMKAPQVGAMKAMKAQVGAMKAMKAKQAMKVMKTKAMKA